jgi:hypothetical protein
MSIVTTSNSTDIITHSPVEERRRVQGRRRVVQPSRCPAEWMHQSSEMDLEQQESVKSNKTGPCYGTYVQE